MRKKVRVFFLALFALAMTACGGGGDDDVQVPSMLVILQGGIIDVIPGRIGVIPVRLTCNREDGCLLTAFSVISEVRPASAHFRQQVVGVWEDVPSTLATQPSTVSRFEFVNPLRIAKGERVIEVDIQLEPLQRNGVFEISIVLGLAFGSADHRGPLPSIRVGG